jgi:hypothetical protein
MDNEPESYRTCWAGQAADYAEFVVRTAAAIKEEDSRALILAPAVAGGGHHLSWIESALDANAMNGSPVYRANGRRFSIGPAADVVSFHIYEGLDSALSAEGRTIEKAFTEIRGLFEKWEKGSSGFEYARKGEYWHTEGNYDFLGILSAERRAAWRWRFFTRSFAAGIRKVCVMDASEPERIAVRTYARALPAPFPMVPAEADIKVTGGEVAAFRHPEPNGGSIWVLWSKTSKPAEVEIPVRKPEVELLHVDGRSVRQPGVNERLVLRLEGDAKMSPPILVIDR